MKASLPSTAKVSKEAKECVQECVSEFISFIVSLRLHLNFAADGIEPDERRRGQMPEREAQDDKRGRHPDVSAVAGV